jgi:ribonuclease R
MARKDQKKKKKKGNSDQVLTGTLDITRSGIGFVIVDKVDKDIMVRPSDFNTALHGDTVRVDCMVIQSGLKCRVSQPEEAASREK